MSSWKEISVLFAELAKCVTISHLYDCFLIELHCLLVGRSFMAQARIDVKTSYMHSF